MRVCASVCVCVCDCILFWVPMFFWSVASVVSDTMSMGSATTGSGNADYHSLPDEIAQGFTDMQSQVPVGNYSVTFMFFLFSFTHIHILLQISCLFVCSVLLS